MTAALRCNAAIDTIWAEHVARALEIEGERMRRENVTEASEGLVR